MKKKYARLTFITSLFVLILASVTMLLSALRENITFYYSPSEINIVFLGKYIRLGGKVVSGSLVKEKGVTTFLLSDSIKEVKVIYNGSLPVLFTKDVEIIVSGKLITDDQFIAEKIFTKHNEVYSRKQSQGNT